MLEACRTCLKIIDVNNLAFYEIEADDVQLSTESCRYKLLSIFPEIALNVTSKPMICADCRENVDVLFEFKAKCLKTEVIITQYLKENPDVDVKNFHLKDVSAFEASIEHVVVKEELESSDVAEEFVAVDDSITIVKHEVDNYSSESMEIVRPENMVLDLQEKPALGLKLGIDTEVHSDDKEHECDDKNSSYKCTVCGKSFFSSDYLKEHMCSKKKPYQCELCQKRYSYESSLVNHKNSRSCVGNFECKYCHKRFGNKINLRTHLILHTGKKPYLCEQCNRRFSSRTNLTIHTRSHSNERPYACTVCGQSYYSEGTLKEHTRTHTKEGPYECETCRKTFSRHSSMILHQKIHSGVRDFRCGHCMKRFVQKHHLLDHIVVHSKQRISFSCRICKKEFTSATYVKNHARKTHEYIDVETVVVKRIDDTSIGDDVEKETQENLWKETK